MKNIKSSIVLSTLFTVSALMTSTSFAEAADISKSTNIKAALIANCKVETAKSGKLTAAEVTKYCGCAIESEGKITNAQKWEIQSLINQKKSPASLTFIQKQNQELQTCFGPQLTSKLKTLTEAAMKSAQK